MSIADPQERQCNEPKKSEESFRSMVSQAPISIYEIGIDGRVISGNRQSLEMFAVDVPEDAIGLRWLEIVADEDRQIVVAAIESAMGGNVARFEFVTRQELGARAYSTSLSPLFDEDGLVAKLLGISNDFTERKQSEATVDGLRCFNNLISSLSADFIRLPADELDDGLLRALESISGFLGVDRGLIFQFSENLSRLSCTHEWHADGVKAAKSRLQELECENTPWIVRRYLNDEPLAITRVTDLPDDAATERRILSEAGVQSLLAVSLRVTNRVLGVVCFNSTRSERKWSDELIARLELVGTIIANALQRQRDDAALCNSEQQYRSLIDYSPDAIFVESMDGYVLDVNPAACRLHGMSREELIGLHVLSLVPKEHAEKVEREFPKLVSGEINHVEGFSLARDGRSIPVELKTSRFEFNGQPALLLHVRDMTERKKVEEALHANREQFRMLAEKVHLIPWQADARSWEVTYVGPQAKDILGYPIENWYETGFWESIIYEKDHPWVVECYKTHIASHEHFEFEYRVVSAEGKVLWIWDIINVVSDENGPTTLRGFMIDVTDRKTMEESLRENETLLRLATDQVPAIIWTTDSEVRLTSIQGAGLNQVDAAPEDAAETEAAVTEAIGKHLCELSPANDPTERILSLHQRVLLGESAKYEAEWGGRYYESYVEPLRDQGGEIVGCIGIALDITQRKRFEEELHCRESELAHMSRVTTTGELAAELAHELNQPLYAITNYAEACQELKDLAPDEYCQKVLHWSTQITEQASRAGGIIRRMSEFLRKTELELTSIDINDLIEETIQLVNVDLKISGVEVELQQSSGLPRIPADRILIQQVLVNLIKNAIESMKDVPKEQRQLTIVTDAVDNGFLTTHLIDRGRGVHPEDRQRLFEPFFSTKEKGLGMGLRICQSSLEMHKGRLWFTENDGPGSTFHFSLPYAAGRSTDSNKSAN